VRHQRSYKLMTFDCDNILLLHLLPFSVHVTANKEATEEKIIQPATSRRTRNHFPSKNGNQAPQLTHQQMGFSF